MPRKEKQFHFIYKTTNLVTRKYYIGMHSTDDLEDGYIGSGKRLRYSVNKYGVENHKREILEFFDTRQELADKEREVVDLDLIAKEDCMNLVAGGEGGCLNVDGIHLGGAATKKKFEEDSEFFLRMSKLSSDRIKKTYATGKIKPPNWKGRNHSEGTKKKLSTLKKGTGAGARNSQFGTMWITNGKENKKIKKSEILPEGWSKGRI